MRELPFIDCDPHIEECEATWATLEEGYRHRRPLHVDLRGAADNAVQDTYWLIDGHIHPRPAGHAATFFGSPPTSTFAHAKPFTIGSQTLDDVPARLADMDRMNIGISVLYPSLFLCNVTDDPRYEAALMRSYNTWLAGRCRQAPDRLAFGALLPVRSPEEALPEIRRVKELGAVALYVMGTAGARLLDHESLDPVYDEAARVGLPIAVHVGWSHPGLTTSCNDLFAAGVISFPLPVLMAFFSMTGGGVLDRHPGLRVGFLEAGADWLPYMVDRIERAHQVVRHFGRPVSRSLPREYLSQGRIYVSVEGDAPSVPDTVRLVGEDYVMTSADIPHAEARDDHLDVMARREDLPAPVREKILRHNPARFYGLKG